MIQAKTYRGDEVSRIYSRRSRLYGKTVAPLEFPNHLRAIEKAAIQPNDDILEVAVGPGLALREMSKYVARPDQLHGVDIAPGMIALAKENLQAAGITNVQLLQGSAEELPFPAEQFDLLYNAYMLDLVSIDDMSAILAEFSRVLKPNGRLILLNMSKPTLQDKTLRERLFPLLPTKIALYVLGGCRPVLMEDFVHAAGFKSVEREFLAGKFPSEIITAVKG